MILKKIKVRIENKDLITNCYIVVDEDTKEAIVIDPGAESDKIISMLDILDAKLKYILLTHCHADHTGALKELKEITNAKILTHRIEAENLQNPEVNLCELIGIENLRLNADARVDDEDILHIRRARV